MQHWTYEHWRRLVKNTGGSKPKFRGRNVVKTDKCMGVSQLLGARAQGAPPKSTPMHTNQPRKAENQGRVYNTFINTYETVLWPLTLTVQTPSRQSWPTRL